MRFLDHFRNWWKALNAPPPLPPELPSDWQDYELGRYYRRGRDRVQVTSITRMGSRVTGTTVETWAKGCYLDTLPADTQAEGEGTK